MDSLLFAAGLTAFALGAAMAAVAWAIARHQHRRRETARARLSELAFAGGMPADDATLFIEPQASGAASRRTLVFAAICLVALIGSGTYYRAAGRTMTAGAGEPPSAPAAEPAPVAATTVTVTEPPSADPLVELLALTHSATRTGFSITGQVRNPDGGATLHDVVAVVQVFDGASRVLATMRAPIKGTVLNAGDSSDFSAAAAKATTVERYRIEFHAGERGTVPHIDRRQRESQSSSR